MRELSMGPRVYTSFEEFEREELRRLSTLHVSIDDYMDECFCEELDFEPGAGSRRRRDDDDDDE